MKKIVSLLLALVMVLSLGVAAFAVDAEDANTTTTEEATPTVTLDQILEWIKGTIMPEINMDLMKEVIKQTKATIENIVELLKPFFDKNQNPNLPDASEIPAAMMNAFIDLLAKAFKTDRDAIINKLLEIPLVKKIMGWYGYKPATTTEAPATSAPETTEAPAETEVPNTGAAAAVAAVASLSVAALKILYCMDNGTSCTKHAINRLPLHREPGDRAMTDFFDGLNRTIKSPGLFHICSSSQNTLSITFSHPSGE